VKALLLTGLLLGQVVPKDAPIVLDKDTLRDVKVLAEGEPAPGVGLWMDGKTASEVATELDDCRNSTTPTPAVIIVALAATFAAGALTGVGLTIALTKR
jgi:hypothetical protein